MAVQEQTPLREYTANGVTTSFALGFDCEETNHLIVTIDDVEVLPTDWYLSGSNVVFWNAPSNGKLIKLQRNTPFNRLVDYQSYNNSFRPPAINKEFDRIWWKLQELGVADWILHNRIDALKAYVDQQDSELQQNIDNLKIYVDDKDDELRAYLLAEIQKQGVALDQLDDYYNYLMQRLAQIAVDKGWEASFVVSAGGDNQQEINDRGGSYWREKPLGYDINSRVMLENGDIVRSTVAGNTVDPNADMTGWVNVNSASQVVDESGRTQQEVNNSLNGLSYAPDLPSNRRLQIIAGSIRNTGDGWKWISDAAHTPVGVTPTVTVSGADIRIDYGFTAKRVVSLIATPDETFAGLGFIVGGSVGKAYTNLQIKAPLLFVVNTSNGAITTPSYLVNAVSATVADGSCTVTHPSIGITGDAPALSKIGASGGHTDVLASYGNTQSTLHGAGDLDGQIIYDGTTWVYSGELKTIPTMEWVVSGADAHLRVVHSRTDTFNINVQSKTTFSPKVKSVSGLEFWVRFYDPDGTLQLAPTTDMQILFSRKACLPKNTIRGSYAVRRGYAGILPSDLISAAGNIWIYGVMEVDS